jgi:hypothetical protein
MFSINLDIGDVVLEDGGDIDLDASRISSMLLEMYILASSLAARALWPRREAGLVKATLVPGFGAW